MTLSTSQFNFLALHVRSLAERWQWYFCNTQLRAHAGKTTATIWRDDLDDLIARGLMFKGAGCADVHATIEGRALILMKDVAG